MKQDPYLRYRRWEPLTPLGKVLVWLLIACGILACVQAIQVAAAMSNVTDTSYVVGTPSRLQAAISPAPIASIASLLGFGAGIVWLIWQHKGQSDLYARAVLGLRYTPGWVVGWWFVPFASLVMPLLCMRELFAHAGAPVSREVPRLRRDWKVAAWWVAYIGTSVLLAVAFIPVFVSLGRAIIDQAGTQTEHIVVTMSASTIHTAQVWAILSHLLRAVAAGLGAWVVWTISTREDACGPSLAPPLPWADAPAAAPSSLPPRPDTW